MKKHIIFLISLFLSCYLFAEIINVPADQPTIQQGINAVLDGDTVLVDPGTYVENIDFNGKNITVASQYLITLDTTFISQTVIDGDSITSVVTFENGEDSTAVLIGFTITNGAGTEMNWPWGSTYGGGLFIIGASPTIKNLIIIHNNSYNGGGLYCGYSSSPAMDSLLVIENSAIESGGGISCSSNILELRNVTITENTGRNGGGISCGDLIISDSISRCNIYNNYALIGNDFYSLGVVSVKIDTFSVLSPTDYHAYPIENFEFDILSGKIEQAEADLYVSPSGDNTNSGLSSAEPLKNIRRAFSKILAGENNPHTIFLMDGTYSPSTNGEVYPLNIPDYVSICGQSQLGTILDGELITPVFRMFGNTGSQIQILTITNGLGGSQPTGGAPYFYAGGISCEDDSSPVVQNVSVTGNYGGISCCGNSSPTMDSLIIEGNDIAGLYFQWGCNSNVTNIVVNGNAGTGILCSYSDPVMEDIIITGNTSHGIWCTFSSPVLKNIVIINNSSYNGGGMHCYGDSYPSLENVTIAYNSAENEGGGIHCDFNAKPVFSTENRCNIYLNEAPVGSDYYAEVLQEVIADTFTVMNPSSYQAYPIHLYDFDILNSKTELIDADLFVSPDGDNINSGLSEQEPLKNIEYAFSMIMADINHQNTIHLMEGTYSTSLTGEPFPIYMLDYVNMIGVSEEEVILDAEGQSEVMIVKNNISNNLSNLTIINGHSNNSSYPTHYSGGITLYNSSIYLSNLTIKNNADGGMSCLYGAPVLENIIIKDNGDIWGGGGLYLCTSNPLIKNVLISGNHADQNGGGVYCNMNASPLLLNVTITDNSSAFAGGLYCSWSSDPELINTILWNNSPEEIGFNSSSQPNTISISYSNIQDGETGIVTNNNGTVNWMEGNINFDPLFTGTGIHTYSLTDQSPCINTGTPDTTGLNLPEFDLAGDLRFRGGRIDMGAYENQNASTFVDKKIYNNKFDLSCIPNPFTDKLTISWNQIESAFTIIEIYNAIGTKIKTPFKGKLSEGKHEFHWKAYGLKSGVYFIKLQIDNSLSIRKIVKL